MAIKGQSKQRTMKKYASLIALVSWFLILSNPLEAKSRDQNNQTNASKTKQTKERRSNPNILIAQSTSNKELARGISLFNTGKFTDSISAFSRVITLNPPSQIKNQALIGRAQAYLIIKQPALAIPDLTSIKYSPNKTEAQGQRDLILGVAFIQLKNYNSAVKWLSQAIKLMPNNASAYSNRAVAFQSLGNLQAATKDLQSSLRINPTPATVYNLAVLEKKKKNYQRCYNLLSEIEKSETPYPGVFLQKGLCAAKLNKTEQALKDLIKAVSLDKTNAFALENIGIILAKGGEKKGAISYLEKAGQLYLMEGKVEEYSRVTSRVASLSSK